MVTITTNIITDFIGEQTKRKGIDAVIYYNPDSHMIEHFEITNDIPCKTDIESLIARGIPSGFRFADIPYRIDDGFEVCLGDNYWSIKEREALDRLYSSPKIKTQKILSDSNRKASENIKRFYHENSEDSIARTDAC